MPVPTMTFRRPSLPPNIWALPHTNRFGFVGKNVLSGWQLNGITTIRAGVPYNVLSGKDTNLDGIATDRSNAVADINLPGGRSRQQKIAQWFSTAAFAHVPAGVPYGNAERNIGIGPSFINTDFSAFKNFSVWRESNLQFRADFFNLFNNVNLANPNTTLTSPSFGKISALCANATPRVIQFALKVLF